MQEPLRRELIDACLIGDDSKLMRILAGFRADDGAESRQALMVSIEQKRYKCVDCLLRHGVSPNFATGWGETPLAEAVSSGDDMMVNLLLEAGADVNFQCGLSPLYRAVTRRNHRMIRRLLAAGANIYETGPSVNRTMIHCAAADSDARSLCILLETSYRSAPSAIHTAHINEHQNGNGDVPLHIAARRFNGHQFIEALLWYGANARELNCGREPPERVAVDASTRRMLEIWSYGAYAPCIRRAAGVPSLQALCAITIVRARVPWRVDTVPHALRAVIAETTGWAADGEWDKPRAPEHGSELS